MIDACSLTELAEKNSVSIVVTNDWANLCYNNPYVAIVIKRAKSIALFLQRRKSIFQRSEEGSANELRTYI